MPHSVWQHELAVPLFPALHPLQPSSYLCHCLAQGGPCPSECLWQWILQERRRQENKEGGD